MDAIQVGDRVRVHLDQRVEVAEGWYPGTVYRIDRYSEHRSFFWVEFDPDVQAALGLCSISVFNPRNIQLISPPH